MFDLSIKTSHDAPAREVAEAALACLRKHSEKVNGVAPQDEPFSVLAFQGEMLVAGMIGKVLWNWLYADLVWVEEEFRRQGVGAKVMRNAEKQARDMHLTGIYLWTETWQAPLFYTKLGYSRFVEFKNFPPGHGRLGFLKYLD